MRLPVFSGDIIACEKFVIERSWVLYFPGLV